MIMQLRLNENTLKAIINLNLQQSYHTNYRFLEQISHVHAFLNLYVLQEFNELSTVNENVTFLPEI